MTLPDPRKLPAADWTGELAALPNIEMPNSIVFLMQNGWSPSMVNNWKQTDGYRLFQDHHVDCVSTIVYIDLTYIGLT